MIHSRRRWIFCIVIRTAALATLANYIDATAADERPAPASTSVVTASREPAFDTDILPLLTTHGCNSGACHGAAVGRGNFALSLFGSDPERDYRSIVHEHQGRRIMVTNPESSLLIAKPTGGIAHGGNELFDLGSNTAQLLIGWIARGAPRGSSIELKSVTVQQETAGPSTIQSNPTGDHAGEKLPDAIHTVRLTVAATFADGTSRDVTEQTLITVDPSSNIQWSPTNATATLTRPGRHVLIARYMDRVVPVVLLRPFHETETDASIPSTEHWIDSAIEQQIQRLGITPAPAASSLAWFRRVCLDLTGRLPTPDQIIEFQNDTNLNKRELWVSRFLSSEAFVDYWTYRLARLLGLRAIASEPDATRAFAQWIRNAVIHDRPYPDMVRELILSEGDSHILGPTNFARLVNDPRSHAELVANVFMGTRMQCANCHNHPFDRWTQDDYHGLAAVFAGVERGRIVRHTNRGQVTNLRTREPALPRIPGVKYIESSDPRMGTMRTRNASQNANSNQPSPPSEPHSIPNASGAGPIEQFADWITDEQNPLLARVMANRLWRAMMGRGLVEPSDDFRETNPPSHPELLHRLAQEYRDSGYRLRPLLTQIALSDAYARSSQSEDPHIDPSFFAVAIRKPLPPEVLLDAIHDALGVEIQDPNSGNPIRAVRWIDPTEPNEALDILGRCSRGFSCGDPLPSKGLAMQLHWMNGDIVNGPLHSGKTFFDPWIMNDAPSRRIIETAYLRIFNREPTRDELARWESAMPAATPELREARQAWVQDWIWSMLSTSEFQSNH